MSEGLEPIANSLDAALEGLPETLLKELVAVDASPLIHYPMDENSNLPEAGSLSILEQLAQMNRQ